MIVLDTNVISELRSGKPVQSARVRAWSATQPTNTLFLTAITLLELELGVQALERRTPPQGGTLRAWLEGVKTTFAGRILPFTALTAPICAALHLPNPRAERDAMIAAIAIEHSFSLATRNTADFLAAGVRLVNPWDG